MKKILIVFLVIFLIGCSKNNDKNLATLFIETDGKSVPVKVEIVDDDAGRMTGLMFREKLEEDEGMLFVFEDENYRSFWMKNTLIPLDMIFIDGGLKIVDIKNEVPCKEDPCALYASKKPARYVLEVNSGFTGKNSIREGNSISLKPENQENQ